MANKYSHALFLRKIFNIEKFFLVRNYRFFDKQIATRSEDFHCRFVVKLIHRRIDYEIAFDSAL